MAKSIAVIILIMVVFGLIILSSAGIIEGQKKFDSPYYHFYHQLLFGVLPGLLLMFVVYKINYHFWEKAALPILFFSLLLMIAVFMPQIGFGLKGAQRWLSIGGFSFQPSEALKLSLIIYFAAWFGGRKERVNNWGYGVAPFFIILAFVGILLALQPDIGTLAMVTIIALSVYFFAGAGWKHILSIVAIILIALIVLVLVEPYRFNRIKTFLDPSVDPRGISYQVNQAHIAIGSGGVFGLGFGKSSQKFGFLPEVTNDSIFAIISEELGFVGSVSTIGLFILLSLMMMRIASKVKDNFAKLFVMGMNVWITGQAFINIAAIAGLMPLTGIPLPFISFGGTSMIVLLAGLGIVLNITKRF
jgi:cell division protein FtsW